VHYIFISKIFFVRSGSVNGQVLIKSYRADTIQMEHGCHSLFRKAEDWIDFANFF
jgi:hypothetical protein